MEEDHRLIWESSQPESMVSATVGRVMGTLLGARPKKLYDAVSRLSSAPNRASPGSLEDSLWFFHKYVKDAAEDKEALDHILVPMIEHSLRCKESKNGGQVLILINWLFQDELLFQALATSLANVFVRKEDRYIALGWCILVRNLLEYESSSSQYSMIGIRERFTDLLKILCSSMSHLLSIVCKGSTLQGGFELPSRLAVSAADCLLALTEALTKKVPSNRMTSNSSALNRPISLVPSSTHKKAQAVSKSSEVSNMDMEYLFWDHLEELINLTQRLLAWSRKSRPLHAKGLEKVIKWLQEIKGHYGCFQDEAGSKILKTGVMLLSSCWKHYGLLLHLEDQKFSQHYKNLLDQYLSGIQYYTDNHTGGHTDDKDGGAETRKFFLNCLCLLLGRLDSKKFEATTVEYGMQISDVLLPQLHCADEDLIDGVVCIYKAVIFKCYSSGSSVTNTRLMDSVLPLLLRLLDERDGTARAVVMLIAEYCSVSRDSQCVQKVLERIASGNVLQRRNAVDVLSELVHISSDSMNKLSHLAWQDIANKLLECLGDEESIIREQASSLLPMIDPSLVFPGLVRLVYSSDERVHSSASDAFIRVLKYHNQKFEVICMLLDSLSNLNASVDFQQTTGDIGEGSKFDSDRVLGLIPEWTKSVQDWDCLIGPLIDKMFAEPSNATIVRFLSYISDHLGEAGDLVIHCVLLHVKGQREIDESLLARPESRTYANHDSVQMQQYLFERLCPLLIIRMLPLRIFDDLNSAIMYDKLLIQGIMHGDDDINNHDSAAALLLNRAFHKFEFDDVRKLAAELCGRIHPQVLFPILCTELEHAAASQDILKIKACLFSVCTSLMIRGRDSVTHPFMFKIRKTLETMLLWPSLNGDEISKAQHGCIDCLAMMICAEFKTPESFASTSEKITIPGKKVDGASKNSTLTYVIHQFVHNKDEDVSTSDLSNEINAIETTVQLAFRLCMANVLISACQKISDSGKKPFARKALPSLIRSAEVIMQPEIRAACIQVLFSAVYHLKSAVLPYSLDLLKLSLKALGKESEKERMAGAKLVASLMASDDVILESISGALLEARSVLSSVSMTDASLELRQVCKKLLICLTP
ncbi:uncharacterized protein LOC122276108 isoform X3 [Carya illinoinensis]|uniref:ARM repeat superfamily protein n=2 Tax=Carya illinoinensis TaxID=32201 RepID=A0A922E054_CARIL|nr:uncharacterized protein LOC122276108 isoform X3 [Carya illinoinensis]KAG6694135.1 hypothetical protein I3842_09G035500 [Carya illinoinensis]KAG6694136.1 hypothetical protein I3842_09G035500 [Carya illinoinensis]KAG6694137.1 hypothetical protein I3842_09G035500 [Carya illinoinensis]